MKRTRKGFTLVELLITVAVAAAMAGAVAMPYLDGPTAKAKAATIARNLSVVTSASTTYYATHNDEDDFPTDANDFIKEALPAFASYSVNGVTYIIEGSTSDSGDDMTVTVTVSGTDAASVKTELAKIGNFSSLGEETPVDGSADPEEETDESDGEGGFNFTWSIMKGGVVVATE